MGLIPNSGAAKPEAMIAAVDEEGYGASVNTTTGAG